MYPRRPMRYFAFVLLLSIALAACDDPASVTPELGEDIPIGVGEQITFDEAGLTIQFREVVSDSRCPEGATCVWAGNANIRIVVEPPLTNTAVRTFALNSYLDPQHISYAGYTIRLVSLDPYPHIDKTIEPDEYVATLHVTPQASTD